METRGRDSLLRAIGAGPGRMSSRAGGDRCRPWRAARAGRSTSHRCLPADNLHPVDLPYVLRCEPNRSGVQRMVTEISEADRRNGSFSITEASAHRAGRGSRGKHQASAARRAHRARRRRRCQARQRSGARQAKPVAGPPNRPRRSPKAAMRSRMPLQGRCREGSQGREGR